MPFFGLLKVELEIEDSGSLKSKRKQIASVKSILSTRYGCAVSEVDHQDLWQRSTLAVALTAGTASGLERVLDRVEHYLEERFVDAVTFERRVVSFADLDL